MFGLASGLLLGLSVISKPAPAGAISTVTNIESQCTFLEDNCTTVDATAVATSTSISVNAAGVWTATCVGTTTILPKKTTKCVGKTLAANCGLETFSGKDKGPVDTEDWVETISPKGSIKLTCKLP